jgi:hypothetical protein
VFCEETALPVAGYFGRMCSPVFIKSVIFFIGHVGHNFLLSVEQRQKGISAFHGMEYLNVLLVNYIIHDFQQIGIAVKSYQQMLFRIVLKYIVISMVTPSDCHSSLMTGAPKRNWI